MRLSKEVTTPHLKVLWDNDKWNRDPSVMDLPSPSARAHIYTQHAVLSEAEVQGSDHRGKLNLREQSLQGYDDEGFCPL